MAVRPEDLVRFGDRYLFPDNERYEEQVVSLTRTQGPTLDMPFGAVAIADPWWPDVAPRSPLIALGKGSHPTTLTTIARTRSTRAHSDTVPVAASIGALDRVALWRPMVQDETHFHLDVDSSLGAFYDITDAAGLQPLFEDTHEMKDVHDRVRAEGVVTMEVTGRDVAVVFGLPDGPGLYPVHAGFDRDGKAVAVLVDMLLMAAATRQEDTGEPG
ncbi:hypothetical protein [Nocardioides sp. P5_C9_2]